MKEWISSVLDCKKIVVLLALLYAVGAIPAAWNVIAHTKASTRAIKPRRQWVEA